MGSTSRSRSRSKHTVAFLPHSEGTGTTTLACSSTEKDSHNNDSTQSYFDMLTSAMSDAAARDLNDVDQQNLYGPDDNTSHIGKWLESLGMEEYGDELMSSFEDVPQIVSLYRDCVDSFFEDC